MLILRSSLRDPTGLTFSPDGSSLLAVNHSTVQVWPRWLDSKPRRARDVGSMLERYAFGPDGTEIFLYISGRSHTGVLNVATGVMSTAPIPSPGPSWFHFSRGGYIIASHDEGTLSRFNHEPKSKAHVSKAWAIERPCGRNSTKTHGSH